AAREVAPIVFESPLLDKPLRLIVRPAYWRRPHAAIHHHFMAPPVEPVVSANPVEAAAKTDGSAHEKARARPREHDIWIVNRHIHVPAHWFDVNVSAVIYYLHLRATLQVAILLRFAA